MFTSSDLHVRRGGYGNGVNRDMTAKASGVRGKNAIISLSSWFHACTLSGGGGGAVHAGAVL